MRDLVDRLAHAGDLRAKSAELNPGGWPQAEEFAAVRAVLEIEYALDEADLDEDDDSATDDDAAERDALDDLGDVFGLDEVDQALLWAAAAVDLDANIGIAYGLLRGTVGVARPSVGLLLELADLGSASADAFARLGSGSVLQRHGLVDVSSAEPWLARTVAAADPVVAVLAGGEPDDPVVTRMRCPLVPLQLPDVEPIARAVQDGVPLVWIRSRAGTAGASTAAGAIASLGLHWLAVDARRNVDAAIATALTASARAAGLLGRALIVLGGDVLADAAAQGVFEALAEAVVPVIVVSTRPWNPAWLARFPLVVDAEPLPTPDREAIWQHSLGDVIARDTELRHTLLGLRLTPEDIAETARYARVLGTAHGNEVDAGIVLQAARRVGGSGGASAERIEVSSSVGGGPTFDDLILPEDVLDSLHRLVTWGRHRNEVTKIGPLRRHGRGIAALFAGNPGTGKTLAAHVVAEALSVDLFQVELSAVVDKYIGETEKNLERVFQAAEAMDVVLFFDEADALFGSRSEVRDARDRYANQEIAYLLQRMERYEGITILATNLRGNLDRAFSRRMSFIVHFPDPDGPTRQRLWQHHLDQLPATDQDDPVLVGQLAEQADLAGGDIRNIVLAATYDAVGAEESVGMRHVVSATVREYHKLGKVVPDHGFLAPS